MKNWPHSLCALDTLMRTMIGMCETDLPTVRQTRSLPASPAKVVNTTEETLTKHKH